MNRRVLLDTTYLLPLFGVGIEIDEPENIARTMSRAVELGYELFISTISILEAYIKTYRLALRTNRDSLRRKALQGALIVMRDPMVRKVPFLRSRILREAHLVVEEHWDPFDAFIVATTRVYGFTLVTDDRRLRELYYDCISWKEFRSMIESMSK